MKRATSKGPVLSYKIERTVQDYDDGRLQSAEQGLLAAITVRRTDFVLAVNFHRPVIWLLLVLTKVIVINDQTLIPSLHRSDSTGRSL